MPGAMRKLIKKRHSHAPPAEPQPEPIVYELPPIGSDWGTDISPDATLKSSAASIRSSASKSPVTASLPHFHKPSRLQADHTRHLPLDYTLSVNRDAANGSIASLYSREQFSRSTEHANTGESPPFQKQFPQSVYSLPKSPSLQIHKRQRQAPAFNLAVIGPRKTGKTSFIRALFSRCELAQHPNTVAGEQDLKRIQSFGSTYNGKVKSTDVTESLTVEMLDGRGDRLALTCVDTSGWDNNSLGEMKAEMAVNNFIKSCELRFASSLEMENQVIRASSRPDTHIHCVLYFIDPDSLLPSSRASPSTPASSKPLRSSKSSPNIGRKSSVTSSGTASESDGHTSNVTTQDVDELVVSALDLRLIKKISKRATVIPVIGRADTLTKRQAREIKEAVNRDLRREGMDYGVIEPTGQDPSAPEPKPKSDTFETSEIQPNVFVDDADGHHAPSSSGMPSTLSAPEMSDAIPLRRSRSRSQSMSRKRRTILNDPDAAPPPTPSTASLAQHLPFSVIAPEVLPLNSQSPLCREYTWGTVNVVDSAHCDFGLLHRTLLQHHLRSFRDATKAFYEAYRTEQLVVRRLTQAQSQTTG